MKGKKMNSMLTSKIFVLIICSTFVACAQMRGKYADGKASHTVAKDALALTAPECDRGLFRLHVISNGSAQKVRGFGFMTSKKYDTKELDPYLVLRLAAMPESELNRVPKLKEKFEALPIEDMGNEIDLSAFQTSASIKSDNPDDELLLERRQNDFYVLEDNLSPVSKAERTVPGQVAIRSMKMSVSGKEQGSLKTFPHSVVSKDTAETFSKRMSATIGKETPLVISVAAEPTKSNVGNNVTKEKDKDNEDNEPGGTPGSNNEDNSNTGSPADQIFIEFVEARAQDPTGKKWSHTDRQKDSGQPHTFKLSTETMPEGNGALFVTRSKLYGSEVSDEAGGTLCLELGNGTRAELSVKKAEE